jgi:hypothetical protein
MRVSTQLQALPVSTSCTPLPTRARKNVTVRSVKWAGTRPGAALEILVTTGMSESEFKQSLGLLGKLAEGQPLVFPGAVFLYEWVNGVGLEVELAVNVASPSAAVKAGKHYAAPVLAFAKAVAKQI